MSHAADASDDFYPPSLPSELRVGQLTVRVEGKLHDDSAWTTVEPATQCDAVPGLADTVRFKFQVTGDSPKPPDTSAGVGDDPPAPVPNPPIPPPRKTPP